MSCHNSCLSVEENKIFPAGCLVSTSADAGCMEALVAGSVLLILDDRGGMVQYIFLPPV